MKNLEDVVELLRKGMTEYVPSEKPVILSNTVVSKMIGILRSHLAGHDKLAERVTELYRKAMLVRMTENANNKFVPRHEFTRKDCEAELAAVLKELRCE